VKSFSEGTPVIFAGNHRSHLDAFLVGSGIVKPLGKRTTIAWMASGKAMDGNPIFGLVRYLGAFPVYRHRANPALNYSEKLLRKKGLALFIAPQGKRIPSHPFHDYFNFMNEGKTGLGRLILSLNGKIPVVPLYIHGSAEALHRGMIIPKFKSPISVSFCKPLSFKKYSRKEGWDKSDPEFISTARKIVDKIMTSIRNEMLMTEKNYFTFLERKFGKKIEQIKIPESKRHEFDKFLFKLLRIHPKRIQNFIETLF